MVKCKRRQRRLLIAAAIFIALAPVLRIGGTMYYTLVHLPDFHGSWFEALKHGLWDPEGWWAFVGTPVWWISSVSWLGSFAAAMFCFWLMFRTGDKESQLREKE